MDFTKELNRLNSAFLKVLSAEEYANNWHQWALLTRAPRSVISLAPAGAGLYLLLRFFDLLGDLEHHGSAAPRAEEGPHGEGAARAVRAGDGVDVVERDGH